MRKMSIPVIVLLTIVMVGVGIAGAQALKSENVLVRDQPFDKSGILSDSLLGNTPPVVSNVGTTGTSGVIDVTYDLTDTDGDLCSIVVEYRGGSAGSTWVSASTTGSLEGLTPGTGLTIEWNSHIDEPGMVASNYQIKITPSDAYGGTPGISTEFYVNNNVPPVVSNVETTGATGVIEVTYDLTDTEGDLCSIVVEYWGGSVGATWVSASTTGSLEFLTPGTGLTIEWNSHIDEPGMIASNYQIRITPTDVDVGTPGVSSLFYVNNNESGAIGPGERAALIAIYNATGGSDWTDDINWLAEPGTECDWYGVTCDASGLTVIKLLLDSNALRGHIPLDIGSLLNLEIFDIAANQVGGRIPPEVGGLSSLRVLTLRDNEVSGSIPSELGNLTNLQSLDLSQNRLSGSMPSELGGYSGLQYLRLYRNQLGGNVPPELTNLVTLFSLELFDNALWTDDLDLAAFLALFDPDWDQTQTIAPKDVAVTITSSTWVWIEWTPIDYIYGDGGYAVFPKPIPSAISIFHDGFESGDSDWWGIGNPWVETTDKNADSIMVDGLTPNTAYTFTVRAITEPHLNNKNQVISEASVTVNATTSP